MKFSIRLNNDLPVERTVALAQAAEQYGFDQFWVSHDLFLRSAWVILSAVAQATTRIRIGTGIVNPYTANLGEIAMGAVTLDELSGGRFNLGIGAGAADFLGWVGIVQDAPLTAMRESLAVLRRLFAGERAAYDGRFVRGWTDEAYLRVPARPVPIYVGAMSPRMLELIGEAADGGLPLLFPPEHYANVQPLVAAGAHRAGRDVEQVDLAACIWCSVSADRAAALDALKEKVAYYGHALSPTIYAQLGLSAADFAPIRQAVVVEDDLRKGKQLVTDAMLRIGVVGTARDVIQRLERLAALGARHFSFGPPLGPDPLEAVAVIGREVIPYFRG
ncbi:MAG: LLM class flavin-dependent oxidoreductase [Chloroflexi bacterium]|nr:LLM class flavin-dependent oxidoreductase [Chloroflexota bacterium]